MKKNAWITALFGIIVNSRDENWYTTSNSFNGFGVQMKDVMNEKTVNATSEISVHKIRCWIFTEHFFLYQGAHQTSFNVYGTLIGRLVICLFRASLLVGVGS